METRKPQAYYTIHEQYVSPSGPMIHLDREDRRSTSMAVMNRATGASGSLSICTAVVRQRRWRPTLSFRPLASCDKVAAKVLIILERHNWLPRL